LNLSGIKHLIFDLGGVIIDLDPGSTFKAFERLTGRPFEHWKEGMDHSQLFLDYEKGLIDDTQFREGVRRLGNITATDAEIDLAWNAMLGNIPAHRIQKVVELGQDFTTYVLSNTNHIHELAFNQILYRSMGKAELGHFFHKVYFSHNMKLRKPDAEIYRAVLDDSGLKPEEVLFLDDKPENLRGAEKLKIQTFHVPSPDSWLELF